MGKASPFSELIRNARQSLGLSQAELAKKVGLQAEVNISKWERGEPVPWHRLDPLLRALPNIQADTFWELSQRCMPAAVTRYHQNRPSKGTEPRHESTATILDFLDTRVREKVSRLHRNSPYVSVATLLNAGIEWYADLALENGLRGDLTPNIPVPEPSRSEHHEAGPGPRDLARKKDMLSHESRKVRRRA